MNILNTFNWDIRSVTNDLGHIKEQGFDVVQINPVQLLKETTKEHWWMSYQMSGFSIGNQYGTKEDLIELCHRAKELGISIVVDVICTHVGESLEVPLAPHPNVEERLLSRPDFWRERRNIDNWKDRWQAINLCAGLPSLNLCNHDLQDIIIDFLNELLDCGVDGFRFDSAKSIALPHEGCDFFPRVLGSLKRQDIITYGEVIYPEGNLLDQYIPYISVLTNWCDNKEKSVVFAESHDTYLGLEFTKHYSDTEITNQYKNLKRDYSNVLYYSRPWSDEWKSSRVREANNITNKIYKRY